MGAFSVIIKLCIIFAKVCLKLYWSLVTSPAQGPATDRMLGHESGTDKRRKLELEMQSLIYLGLAENSYETSNIHNSTPYHKPRNHYN